MKNKSYENWIFAIAITFLITYSLYFGSVLLIHRPECDCSGGTVFVLDDDARAMVGRTANALIQSGDTLSGNILKQVLMSKQ